MMDISMSSGIEMAGLGVNGEFGISGNDSVEAAPLRRDLAESDSSSLRPILLVSAPRSGSTWVARTLGLAPNTKLIMEPFNPNMPIGASLVDQPHWYEYLCDESGSRYEAVLD